MIRLTRPPIPASLSAVAANATKALWASFQAGKPVAIDSTIYAHPSVKNALRTAQHDKCAYCETLNPTSHEVVEHFRPKNGWRQKRGDSLIKPEYFWLAYEWTNLLFACDQCNDRGHKENLFPLANPTHRATARKPKIEKEKPLLLNPYENDDPQNHIEWNRDIPRPRNGSSKGRETITAFKLDEASRLLRIRKDHLETTEKMLTAVEALPVGHVKRLAVKPVFQKYIGAEGPWSAMLRANLEARILAL